MSRLGPGGLFALTGGEASGESEYSNSTSIGYSEITSNVSAPSSSLSGNLNNLKPALSVPRQQQLLFADSSPSPVSPQQQCTLASAESLEPKMQPVGSFLCGTVRVSVQREERKKEVEVEESPAYLPTSRHHLHHLPVLNTVADTVAGARHARGLVEEKWADEEGGFHERRLRFKPD